MSAISDNTAKCNYTYLSMLRISLQNYFTKYSLRFKIFGGIVGVGGGVHSVVTLF